MIFVSEHVQVLFSALELAYTSSKPFSVYLVFQLVSLPNTLLDCFIQLSIFLSLKATFLMHPLITSHDIPFPVNTKDLNFSASS